VEKILSYLELCTLVGHVTMLLFSDVYLLLSILVIVQVGTKSFFSPCIALSFADKSSNYLDTSHYPAMQSRLARFRLGDRLSHNIPISLRAITIKHSS